LAFCQVSRTFLDRPVATLSGGEATLCGVAGLLLRHVDILLLDEPTNNLDGLGRELLYGLIDGWPGALIVVSHDRDLLERVDQTVELREATKLHREGLKAADDIANDHLYAQLLDQLGLDAMTSGDLTGARDYFGQAAEVHARLLDQEDSSYCLDGLAAVALAQQRPEVAARLLGASAHARELVGVAVWPVLKPLAEALRAAVAAALGEAEFARATALGAQMRLNEALACALDSTSPNSGPEPARSEA
jgi:energy-coupling factor transporter ATP-binding protein EcfA2